VTDAVKSVRQHMDQEATDELPAVEAHDFLAVFLPIILPAKLDFAVTDRHQAVIGDGDAMGIPPDVLQNLGRSRERRLGIDNPFNVVGWCQIPMEGSRLLKMTMLSEELQLTGGEGLLQI